jgi:hypothetical protein
LIAETLRLEVEPFDVNVIEIVTGAVKSLGQTYFEDHAIPENSIYKSVEATIKSRAQGNDGLPRMPLEDYSAAVTDEMIKRTPGKFWYGQNADLVKMSTTATAVPQSAMVSRPTPFPQPLKITSKLILTGCGRDYGNWPGRHGQEKRVSRECIERNGEASAVRKPVAVYSFVVPKLILKKSPLQYLSWYITIGAVCLAYT